MNLLEPIPALLAWPCNALMVWVLLWVWRTAQWRQLMAVSIRQHLWYGSIVALTLVWSFLGVPVKGALFLHPMLVTALVLVFGGRLALAAATAALIITTTIKGYPWAGLGFVWLCSILGPTVITWVLLQAVTRTRIQNLFLYTLGIGFVGGLLTAISMALSALLLLWLSGAAQLGVLWSNAYLFLLFTFPEGFLNGYIVSALAIMAPQLVKTYDDDFYLK